MEEETTGIGTDSFEDIQIRPDAPDFKFDTEVSAEAATTQAQEVTEEQTSTTAAAGDSTSEPKASPEGEAGKDNLQPVEGSPYAKADGSLDLEKLRKDGDAFDSAFLDGVADFGVDLLNIIPGVDIQKKSDYENQTAQSIRDISSVVVPTIAGGTALKAAGTAANARVGWSIGQSPFIQQFGRAGADIVASMAVGAVSSEYEGDNILGTIKKNFPAFGDFIPDSLATLDDDSPDQKRAKNIKEDILGGAVIDLLAPTYKLVRGMFANRSVVSPTVVQKAVPQLVGETPAAQKWIDSNKPPTYLTPEEEVMANVLKREESLDELGAYNLSVNPKMDTPLKGVHDMFDEAELGMRQVDNFGIAEAGIDAARISKNLDTVEGRLANFISEPALKYALSDADAMGDVSLTLAKQLQDAGEIGQVGKGWKVSYADQVDATMDIAVDLFDPRMTKADIDRIIKPLYYTDEATGKEILGEAGFGMITKALKGFGDEITALNYTRAQALTAGSTAGRIADIAEGMRLADGSVAVANAQEKMIDLMKHLYRLQGEAKYYMSRKANLLDQMQNGFKDLKAYNNGTVEGGSAVAQELYKKSEYFGQSIKQIADSNPTMMGNFLKAYELTGGKISTINDLNTWVANKTGVFGKAFVDLSPDEQSLFIGGLYNNIYNSVLSAGGTTLKAGFGNIGGIISKPLSHFTGAVVGRDWKAMQRNWIAYSSIGESIARALPYAGDVFRKASQAPSSVSSATRRDLIIKNEADLQLLKDLAQSKAAEGDDGLMYMVQSMENMYAMSKDPFLRWGVNAMTGLDAFTGSMMASAESKFRVMDKLANSGKPITKEAVAALEQAEYAKMFDENGLLKDEAVKWTTAELALNLNSPLADGISGLTNSLPILKPFLMFPTTIANGVSLVAKYSPFALFSRDYRLLSFAKTEQLLGNTQFIDDFLSQRGIDISSMSRQAKENKIIDIKYEVQGRIALGTSITAGFATLMMQDRITGSRGLINPAKQKARTTNTDWQPMTITLPGGERVSYAGLGPISELIGLTVDVMDNFDQVGEDGVGEMLGLITSVLSAGLYDQTGMSTVKPLLDMASGRKDPQRWAAGYLNSMGPLSGARNEWSRIFTPGVKMAEKHFSELLRSKNSFIDGMDPSANDSYVYNPVTGKKKNDYNFMQRLWNATNPYKVYGELSPEEEYLTDIGFKTTVQFAQLEGVEIPVKTQSELMKIVGEQGIFRRAIKDEMKIRSQEDVQQIILDNGGQVDDDLFLGAQTRLRKAINNAKAVAVESLPPQMRQELLVLQAQKREEVMAATRGEPVRDIADLTRK